MDLRPCGCGEARFERASSIVEFPGGELARRYAGKCAGCANTREFVFALPAGEPLPAGDEIRYGDDEPSQLLDAGEWLTVADQYARLAAGAEQRTARARLAAAAAAVDEVLKFVPVGAERVPATALWTAAGASIYHREPGRFKAARLAAVRDSYRKSLSKLA